MLQNRNFHNFFVDMLIRNICYIWWFSKKKNTVSCDWKHIAKSFYRRFIKKRTRHFTLVREIGVTFSVNQKSLTLRPMTLTYKFVLVLHIRNVLWFSILCCCVKDTICVKKTSYHFCTLIILISWIFFA